MLLSNSIIFEVIIISAFELWGIIAHIAWVWKWLAVTKKLKLFFNFKRAKTWSIASETFGNISLVILTELDNKDFKKGFDKLGLRILIFLISFTKVWINIFWK